MNRHCVVSALVSAALLAACTKVAVQNITGPFPSSRVKFFNFGVGAPGVNFYANETKMTAIFSATGTESTIGVPYGGAGASGLYTAIAPGQYTLSGRIAAATNKNLPICGVTVTIGDGAYYSFYMSGVYDTTTKTVDGFVVQDPLPAQTDYSVAYVRFVHAIANANPLILVAKSTTTGDSVVAGAAVAYKQAGTFTALPPDVYNLYARYPDSTRNVITSTAVSFSGARVYTVGARGDVTVASGTKAPFLDNTPNR